MIYTDDPVADFERHDAEQQSELDKLPQCDYCDAHIDSYYYEIDNECLCENCMNEHFRKRVEDY